MKCLTTETGTSTREFLHVDDLSDAQDRLLKIANADNSRADVGTKKDLIIFDLTNIIAGFAAYTGEISFDKNILNGSPSPLLSLERRPRNWAHKISLVAGLYTTYRSHPEGLHG